MFLTRGRIEQTEFERFKDYHETVETLTNDKAKYCDTETSYNKLILAKISE